MNDFETSLIKMVEESGAIQQRQMTLEMDMKLFNEKFMGFLKENGLPETFSMPQLALLCIRKSRDLIQLPK